MKTKALFLPLSLAFVFLFSACTLGQYSPEQLEATVQQMAATGMVLTLTAMPSSTLLPTVTSTNTPVATATQQPTLVPTGTLTAVPTIAPTYQPTATSFGQAEPTDFADNKADKDDKNAPLLLDNQSGGEEIHLIILSPVYGDYVFTGNMVLILPEASYTYRAWIGDKGPLNGSFAITNGDKHVLTFFTNKIHFSTP